MTYLLWVMLWGTCAGGIYVIARDAYYHRRRDQIIRRILRSLTQRDPD